MKFLHIAVLSLFVFAACNKMEGSSEPVTSAAKGMLASAETLNKAILAHDYATFVKYTHPKIVEISGGEQKFKEMMTNGAKNMEAAGAKFISITNGEPGKIITVKDELQSTLPQTIEIQAPKEKVRTHTTLIAISKDNGKTWQFIDTYNTNLKMLREMLPELSSEIVIPPPQKPEVIK